MHSEDGQKRVVLASASPRRRELLGQLGVPFDVYPPEVDESVKAGENAKNYALRVACLKAGALADRFRDRAVLAADTTVALTDALGREQLFGKPKDAADAARMLTALGGRTHTVTTGMALRYRDDLWTHHVQTEVTFSTLPDWLIRWYVATGEPMDKAGAYGIQGQGGVLVQAIHGSYSNVVGLPLAETLGLLRNPKLPLEWEFK